MHNVRAVCVALPVALLFSSGCALVGVPEDTAVQASFRPIPWVRGDCCGHLDSFAKLSRAVQAGLEPAVDSAADQSAEYQCVGRFLHISDAHLRDETIYASSRWKRRLLFLDRAAPVATRNRYVEAFDSLTYASFLIGYGKGQRIDGPVPSFIVHGGDLLDLSLTTELVEAMRILRAFARAEDCRHVPLYSMVGNHDGLIFGSLPGRWVRTRDLGVNGTEFVLAHLLADPVARRGFGFGGNEIIQSLAREAPGDQVRRFRDELREAADRRAAIRNSRQVERLLSIPAVVRNAIRTSGEGDRLGLRCGYYSWTTRVKGADEHVHVIRYIALDTRSSKGVYGQIHGVQLGWLYNELAEAMSHKECVVLFAHHRPGEITGPGPSRNELHALLASFPNIAAYFHGHRHRNEERPPGHRYGHFLLAQTGSTADFPQTGRQVSIFVPRSGPDGDGSMAVKVRWRHVRPAGDQSRADGLLLQAALDASSRDATREYNKWSVWQSYQKWFKGRKRAESFQSWAKDNLRPGEASVTIRFLDAVPKPGTFFSPRRLKKINALRLALGLREVSDETPQ